MWRHSAGDIIAYASTTLVGLGTLWRYVVRPMRKAWRRVALELEAVHKLASKELTHNGGASLKDAVHRIDNTLSAFGGQISNLTAQESEMKLAVEAVAQVIDELVDRKQEDHERIWKQIVELGGEDPRHPST